MKFALRFVVRHRSRRRRCRRAAPPWRRWSTARFPDRASNSPPARLRRARAARRPSGQVRRCASRSSSSRRAFSMAMTAWAAKLVDQRDLLVGKRPDLLAKDQRWRRRTRSSLTIGHEEESAHSAKIDKPQRRSGHAPCRRLFGEVGNVHNCFIAATRMRRNGRWGETPARDARISTNASGALCVATTRNASPSGRTRDTELGFADARRILENRHENRLQIAGRTR